MFSVSYFLACLIPLLSLASKKSLPQTRVCFWYMQKVHSLVPSIPFSDPQHLSCSLPPQYILGFFIVSQTFHAFLLLHTHLEYFLPHKERQYFLGFWYPLNSTIISLIYPLIVLPFLLPTVHYSICVWSIWTILYQTEKRRIRPTGLGPTHSISRLLNKY